MYTNSWLDIYFDFTPTPFISVVRLSFYFQMKQRQWKISNKSMSLWLAVQVIDLVTFQSTTGSDRIQLENWNLIWMACVNLMVRGPFRLLILEVKRTLWGHRLQIYYPNFPWQRPALCASKQRSSEKCVPTVGSDCDLEISLREPSQGGGKEVIWTV